MQDDIEALSGVRPGPGTLYGAIRRLEERGYIKAMPEQNRRKPYHITSAGREALRAELTQMRALASTGLRRLAAQHVAVMRDPSRLYRLVLQLYPHDVRDRYGRELLALLADSPRPWRDVLDVIHCALADRTELLLMTYLRPAAAVLAAIGLFALGYAVNDLQDGLTELPRHWWSAAPVGLLLVAALLWLTPAIRRSRRSATE